MAGLKKKNVLVTGAGGFIGSHLTERLADMGCFVRAFVRYNSRRDIGLLCAIPKEKIKGMDIVLGDLRDYDAVEKALKRIDVVFHLGALIAIPYSYINPREVIESNIIGTLNILTACRKNKKVSKIVHTSTSEVYGTALYVPIDEKHPLQAQSPYSASKISADKLAESFYRSYDLPVATIRPFNTYGPRQSLRSVIPTIITQALTGDIIKLGSLEPRRDFTYVSDTVDAFIRMSESDAGIGKVINLGTNSDISIKELVKKIGDILDKDLKVVQKKERARPEHSEVQRLHADNRLAMKLIGWKPKMTLDQGLRETIDWFSDNINSIREKQDIEEYTV